MGRNLIISKRIIEDIFVLDETLLSKILNVNADELVLLTRQKRLDNGILDLLYVYKCYQKANMLDFRKLGMQEKWKIPIHVFESESGFKVECFQR